MMVSAEPQPERPERDRRHCVILSVNHNLLLLLDCAFEAAASHLIMKLI